MEKFNINSLPIIKLLTLIFVSISISFILPKTFLIAIILILGAFGLLLFLFKKDHFAYLFLAFAIGFIISTNFEQIKIIETTEKFTSAKMKVFGKVTDIIMQSQKMANVRLQCQLNNEQIQNYSTSLSLIIHKTDGKFPELQIGDIILCIAKVKLPRVSNLPTDPAEVQTALSNDVELLASTNEKNIIKIWENPSGLHQTLGSIKNCLNNKIYNFVSQENFPYFTALLLGNRTMLESEQREKFATTGMSHILALSGFHFGILATIVFYLFSFLKNNWIKFVLVVSVLLTYLAIIGFPPSGIRASIMIIAILYSLTLERKTSIFNILGLIILVVLIFSPSSIFNVGFQLSFFAVLGIVLFNKRFYFALNKIVKVENNILNFFLQILATTISAQIFTAPLVAYYFGYYTFISFFSNLLLLPIFSLAIGFGFNALFLSLISIDLAKIFGTTADFLLALAIRINEFLADNFKELVLNHNSSLLVSIFVSLFTLWVVYSTDKKILFTRLAISIISLVTLLFNLNQNNRDQIQIFPREKYIAIVIPDPQRTVCLLLDRKPRLLPSSDKPMEKYLTQIEGELVLGVSGNVGIAITDRIKRTKRIKIVELPKEIQREISKKLVGDYGIFKL